MDELLEILEDIDPDNDYENDEHLIDDAHLDSLCRCCSWSASWRTPLIFR